jgi:hypothetical protein
VRQEEDDEEDDEEEENESNGENNAAESNRKNVGTKRRRKNRMKRFSNVRGLQLLVFLFTNFLYVRSFRDEECGEDREEEDEEEEEDERDGSVDYCNERFAASSGSHSKRRRQRYEAMESET